MVAGDRDRAAWYVVGRQWSRWSDLLHWPYLMWHLSYVTIGASLAEQTNLVVLAWTTLAFACGMGIAGHAYDLLNGDPLRLGIKRWQLHIAGMLGLLSACGIGVWQIVYGPVSAWLLSAIPIGALLAIAYGLEWEGAHGDWQFAAWWAGFPAAVGYLAQGIAWDWTVVPALAFCILTAYGQRVLSTRARFLRRHVQRIVGTYTTYEEQWCIPWQLDKSWMLAPLDRTLALLSFAMVTLAAMMLLR